MATGKAPPHLKYDLGGGSEFLWPVSATNGSGLIELPPGEWWFRGVSTIGLNTLAPHGNSGIPNGGPGLRAKVLDSHPADCPLFILHRQCPCGVPGCAGMCALEGHVHAVSPVLCECECVW